MASATELAFFSWEGVTARTQLAFTGLCAPFLLFWGTHRLGECGLVMREAVAPDGRRRILMSSAFRKQLIVIPGLISPADGKHFQVYYIGIVIDAML